MPRRPMLASGPARRRTHSRRAVRMCNDAVSGIVAAATSTHQASVSACPSVGLWGTCSSGRCLLSTRSPSKCTRSCVSAAALQRRQQRETSPPFPPPLLHSVHPAPLISPPAHGHPHWQPAAAAPHPSASPPPTFNFQPVAWLACDFMQCHSQLVPSSPTFKCRGFLLALPSPFSPVSRHLHVFAGREMGITGGQPGTHACMCRCMCGVDWNPSNLHTAGIAALHPRLSPPHTHKNETRPPLGRSIAT